MYPRLLQKFDNFLLKAIYRYANRKWYRHPFGKKIKADSEIYLKLWEDAKSKEFPVIEDIEKITGFALNKDFFHELALHTQVVVKKSDILYQHGRLLYSSLRQYIKENNIKNINILETGTARGFSSLCMAKALEDAGISGKIITFDVLPHHTKMYWNCIDDHDGLKTRAQLLKAYRSLCENYIIFHQGNSLTEMKKVSMTRIGFAFLDGGHDYYHVMNEFKHIEPYQEKGDMIFFDDYTPDKFPGVVNAVNEICDKYAYHKKVIEINDSRAYVVATKI